MSFFDEGFSFCEWRVCDEFCGGGVKCLCDAVEFVECDVAVDKVLDVLFAYAEFFGELYLCHSFCFEDEHDIFFDACGVHAVLCLLFCAKVKLSMDLCNSKKLEFRKIFLP